MQCRGFSVFFHLSDLGSWPRSDQALQIETWFLLSGRDLVFADLERSNDNGVWSRAEGADLFFPKRPAVGWFNGLCLVMVFSATIPPFSFFSFSCVIFLDLFCREWWSVSTQVPETTTDLQGPFFEHLTIDWRPTMIGATQGLGFSFLFSPFFNYQ